ncbi:MAG: hypothetical protein DWB45_10845 [Xanthomonadales bacterium]|nr:hypothetical protein [Xanthomonadales bacterium]MCC6595502.1 hypothetical protein [Rhodanobacteraceae bacterium]MDL1869127.1 hypothetical protein [Gammaproteobacteria bacterium PRO6]
MRSFTDTDGCTWQAAVLDASYGVAWLVFTPLQQGRLRRQRLAVENLAEALALLADLDEAGLRAQLADAEPWDPAGDPG